MTKIFIGLEPSSNRPLKSMLRHPFQPERITSNSFKMIKYMYVSAEPPSYDSLFGRIRDTHKASRNVIDFVLNVTLLLLGTIGCTIACSITVVIPFCMIVIGSVYFHDCPAEPYIPIFLIVGGNLSFH